MTRHSPYIKILVLLVAGILFGLPAVTRAMNLPLNKALTVKLSTLDSSGQLQTVRETVAHTDSSGKIVFSFSTVPSSVTTPFLHIQIVDGASVLRQTIIPSPQPGGNIDVGISEVTDLQARSILKAAAVSGKLSPIHLLVAHALLRTPTISSQDAEAVGTAIAAGADAISNVLSADGVTTTQLSRFSSSLLQGLADAAAIYRASVDDALASDQRIENDKRAEAFAALLQALISAGSNAGINLETVCAAFTSGGVAAEAVIESPAVIDPVSKASIRAGFVSGIITLSIYRNFDETLKSLAYVGIVRPRFARIFDTIDLMQANILINQKSIDSWLLEGANLGDVAAIRSQEFNSLSLRDLLLWKVGMESYSAQYVSTEYAMLTLDVTSRMATIGGVMSGMTPTVLAGILGISVSESYDPSLSAFPLAAWSYVNQLPSFVYTPIPGLFDQVVSKPMTPAFDQLGEPYKSIALLEYDLKLINSISWQEQTAAEYSYFAEPQNPQRWLPLASVYQLQDNNRQRLSLVRQHMSGLLPEAKSALIGLLKLFYP